MRNAEKIQPPQESKKGTKESEGEFDEKYQNNGYSKKGSHKYRSEAGDDRKISRRR